MKIDGVTFVDSQVKQMSKKKFVDMHIVCLWQNLSEENRRKKLTDIYERITGKSVKEVSGVESGDK